MKTIRPASKIKVVLKGWGDAIVNATYTLPFYDDKDYRDQLNFVTITEFPEGYKGFHRKCGHPEKTIGDIIISGAEIVEVLE